MTNKNCLEGMRCPSCGQDEHFVVHGFCSFDLWDEGSEAIGDHEWDDDCLAICQKCDWEGSVRELHEPR